MRRIIASGSHGYLPILGRSAPPWMTAAVLVIACMSDTQASSDQARHLGDARYATTSDNIDYRGMEGRIEFAALPLHREGNDKSMRVAQATAIDSGEVQQCPEVEFRRPEPLFDELTLARRDIELLQRLEQEYDRAEQLEHALAAARRDVETLTALATKASGETAEPKQAAEGGSAELRNSLQQERDQVSRLEQALAAARYDVDSQTALAAKASDEVALLKQAAEGNSVELQKSLQQERDRAGRLEQALAAAQRDVETQTTLATKASGETAKLKQAAEGGSAELQDSLQQERDRVSRLEQALAAARYDVDSQTALAAKASDEVALLKQAAEGNSVELKKSLQQERDRAGRLEQALAVAHRDVETQTALATRAGDEVALLKRAAEGGFAVLQNSLQQERDRTGQLEQALAAARREIDARTALAAKANDEVARLTQAAKAGAAEQTRSFQKEHERADALAQDLSMARSKIYAYEAQAAKANEEAAQHKQAEASDTASLGQSQQRERERTEQLARDLAKASSDLDAQTERASKASEEVLRIKQAGERDSAELRSLLLRERERAEGLERDLALARQDKGALLAKISPAASPLAAAGKPARDEPLSAPARPIQSQRVQDKPVQDQAIAARSQGDAPVKPNDGVQAARLITRASVLLEQGNIGAARIVLERAVEMGSAQASFALAETYDPLILPNFRTYGTQGDLTKARTLYARAEAGGIKEAKARFEALRR
ncbi:hypothetical protein [Bradyrhizobium sp. P5_C12]